MTNQFLVTTKDGKLLGQFSLDQLLSWFDNDSVNPCGFTAVVDQMKKDGLTVAEVL